MPSNHLYAIRRAILFGPPAAFLAGFAVTLLVGEMDLWGPVFWLGLALTILYVLWRLATMLDELHESA